MSLMDSMVFLQAAPAAKGGMLFSFMPLLFMVVIFYFLLIRPQQKKQKLHQQMLSELKKGDRVLSSGGLYALIERVKEDGVLVVKIADNVKVELAKSAVAAVVKVAGQEQPVAAGK